MWLVQGHTGLSTIDSIIFSVPGSPSLLPALSSPIDLGAPEALSKAMLMGSWRGASPNFITLPKVGTESETSDKTRGREQGPAGPSFRAGDGEQSWHGGPGGGPGQPLRALCEQMLGPQPTLAIVPTTSAEAAKPFSPMGQ